MSNQEHISKIQEIIKDVKFAMMSTTNKKGDIHAWPMTTNKADVAAKEIWFIGDKTSDVVKDIQNDARIGLTYATQDEKNYVSISGNAELSTDKDKLDELWSPVYNAFFAEGKEDENVQLIKVVPHGAECWISGSSVVNMFMTLLVVFGTLKLTKRHSVLQSSYIVLLSNFIILITDSTHNESSAKSY